MFIMVYLIGLLVLAAITLSAIMYIALSKKTGPRTRIAALIALAVMILTVIVCLIVIFGGTALVKTGEALPADLPVENPAVPGNNVWILLAFIVFLIVLFAVVAVLSFREQRRPQNTRSPSGRAA
jgi:amino acid transporter